MLGRVIARRVTSTTSARNFPIRILDSSERTLTVRASERTSLAGEWGLYLRGGGHTRVSGVPLLNGLRATWTLAAGSSAPATGEYASWSGIVAPNPRSAGLDSSDHVFGPIPTWFIDAAPSDHRPVWAVHVHGLGSSRAGTLRGVVAASAAGLPSVIPAYRNTPEGPHIGSGRSTLGVRESEDIASVMSGLSVTGDERFVLFGWSLGAQVALRLAADPLWASRIDRLVLDSPVLDWRSVISANLTHSHLPRAAARLADPWLQDPRKARRLGLDEPLNLDEMDWVARAGEVRHPVLIHHGTTDWSVPIAGSEAFVAAAPDAQLITTGGGHTTSWNVAPAQWHTNTQLFTRAAL